MNQNHKIDIIQILHPHTSRGEFVYRVICEKRHEMGRIEGGLFGKYFRHIDTRIRQAFEGSVTERHACTDSLEHTMRLIQEWGIIYYMACNYNIPTDQY